MNPFSCFMSFLRCFIILSMAAEWPIVPTMIFALLLFVLIFTSAPQTLLMSVDMLRTAVITPLQSFWSTNIVTSLFWFSSMSPAEKLIKLFALKAFNDAKKIKNTNAVTTLFFILLRFFMQKYLRKYKKPNLFVVNSCR